METASARVQRRDRLLPADRTTSATDAPLLGRARRVSKPSQHRYQKFPGHARPGLASRVGRISSGACEPLHQLALRRSGARTRTARFFATAAAGCGRKCLRKRACPWAFWWRRLFRHSTITRSLPCWPPRKLREQAGLTPRFCGYRLTVSPVFQQWLEEHVPKKKEKILGRIRSIRGGKLNDARFGSRMSGEGIFADQIHQMFPVARRKAGIPEHGPELSAAAFRKPEGPQLQLGL